jgi:hypothetical protein
MVDVDIGDTFLNFFLDPNLRNFAGVDLKKFFPEHGGEGEVWWVRCAHIAMGLRPSPFTTAQIIAWLEEIIFGYRREKGNVFTWDIAKLNLPGRLDYDPFMPWAYKLMLDDGKIAVYFLLYIDDTRPTRPTE